MNLHVYLFLIVNCLLVSVISLLLMFSNLTPAFTKKLLLAAAGMIALPLTLAIAGNAAGVLNFSLIDILLIREGSISLLVTMSYGVLVGIVLNKAWSAIRGKPAQPEPVEEQ